MNNISKFSLKTLNLAIQKEIPNVFLVKGNGYFYIASNDQDLALKIAGLNQSGIYVSRLNELSIDRWIKEIYQLFKLS